MNRNNLFLGITVIITLTTLVAGFFDLSIFNTISANLVNWSVIIGLVALATAIISLMRMHVKRIMTRRREWFYSLYFIVVFTAVCSIGLIYSSRGQPFMYVVNNILVPLSTTIYSLLGLWMATAAYRAFRVRSIDSTILLVTGIIVLLGSTSFGAAISPVFARITIFIRLIPTTAASRGILISGGLGAIALGIRILLGVERGHIPGQSK